MKTRMACIASVVIGLAAAVAYAQSPKVKAQVPFAFYAGAELMPQGTYEIGSLGAQHAVTQIAGAEKNIVLLSNPLERNDSEEAKLVFHRYGDEYFLAQIWRSGKTGRELRPSAREKELTAGGARAAMVLVVAIPR